MFKEQDVRLKAVATQAYEDGVKAGHIEAIDHIVEELLAAAARTEDSGREYISTVILTVAFSIKEFWRSGFTDDE